MFVKIPKIIQLLYPSITWTKKTSYNEVWLTFDDGPDPLATPWILKILKEKEIKATFFLIGKKMQEFPDLVQQIINEGHCIGNHSYSHMNGWKNKTKNYINDINKCQDLMPKNFLFRPPYGKITSCQIKKLKKIYNVILWDIMAYDFKKNITAYQIKKNILQNISKGSIIVLHNNQKSYKNLKPILSEVIDSIKDSGFKFSSTW